MIRRIAFWGARAVRPVVMLAASCSTESDVGQSAEPINPAPKVVDFLLYAQLPKKKESCP